MDNDTIFTICRKDCTCAVCGKVRLHLVKRVRKSKKPQVIDPAVGRLNDVLRSWL